MTDTSNQRGNWGSKFGFILAAAGSAIGLGNIWRFPYVAGENGGAAFVLIYLIFVIFISAPVMLGELSIGRHAERNPIGAFKNIVPGSWWKLVGFLGVLTGVGILSFYAVIAGWTLQYAVKSVINPGYIHYSQVQADEYWRTYNADIENIKGALAKYDLTDKNVAELGNEELMAIWENATRSAERGSIKEEILGQLHTEGIFSNFTSDPLRPVFFLFIFLLLTGAVVAGGVSSGIERWSKILMPVLFLLLILLAIRSVTLKGAAEGLAFYLKPDFTKIRAATFARALGQAFFSLSLGMGTMLTYGSYISKKDNLVTSAGYVCFFDTLIAILAGLVTFPALFAMGLSPDQGSNLVFIVLPSIFSKIPAGTIFGAGFFLLLCVAALTSTISLLEVPVSYLVDERKWTRRKAVVITGLISFVLGVVSALSTGAVPGLSNLPGIGLSFLDFFNALFGNYSLSVGALLISIFVGYKWGISAVANEIEQENNIFYYKNLFAFLIRFISPVGITMVLSYIIITGKYF